MMEEVNHVCSVVFRKKSRKIECVSFSSASLDVQEEYVEKYI